MVPSQEANGDNLGIFFFVFIQTNCMLSDEAILMSTLNINFRIK